MFLRWYENLLLEMFSFTYINTLVFLCIYLNILEWRVSFYNGKVCENKYNVSVCLQNKT